MRQLTDDELCGLAVLSLVGTALADEFEEETDSTVSETAQKRMRRMIRTETERMAEEDRACRFRSLRRVAIVVFALLLVHFTLVSTVDAYQEALYRIFTRNGDRAVEVQIDPRDDIEPIDASVLVYAPTYLPEGYALERIETHSTATTAYYRNGDAMLEFEQAVPSASYSVDNEHGETGQVDINGREGAYALVYNETILIWSNGEANFLLDGELSLDELVTIANSVQKRN